MSLSYKLPLLLNLYWTGPMWIGLFLWKPREQCSQYVRQNFPDSASIKNKLKTGNLTYVLNTLLSDTDITGWNAVQSESNLILNTLSWRKFSSSLSHIIPLTARVSNLQMAQEYECIKLWHVQDVHVWIWFKKILCWCTKLLVVISLNKLFTETNNQTTLVIGAMGRRIQTNFYFSDCSGCGNSLF
jgi:hypothetical protein